MARRVEGFTLICSQDVHQFLSVNSRISIHSSTSSVSGLTASMSSICCQSLIKSWIVVTSDLLTQHVLNKCLIYCDKGRDRAIVLRQLLVPLAF